MDSTFLFIFLRGCFGAGLERARFAFGSGASGKGLWLFVGLLIFGTPPVPGRPAEGVKGSVSLWSAPYFDDLVSAPSLSQKSAFFVLVVMMLYTQNTSRPTEFCFVSQVEPPTGRFLLLLRGTKVNRTKCCW